MPFNFNKKETKQKRCISILVKRNATPPPPHRRSHDRNDVQNPQVKSVSAFEVAQLRKILPAYIEHFRGNPDSLLTRICAKCNKLMIVIDSRVLCILTLFVQYT